MSHGYLREADGTVIPALLHENDKLREQVAILRLELHWFSRALEMLWSESQDVSLECRTLVEQLLTKPKECA